MPGIAGFCDTALAVDHRERTVASMRAFLTHESFYTLDDVFCDATVAGSGAHLDVLPHTPQPCTVGHVRVWIDGELFNQAELTKGQNLNSTADAQILAHLADRDPSLGFLERVDGGFSAVIWDAGGRRVTLVSDRYGSRPLYWTRYRTGIAWSTESKAFLALSGLSLEIRRAAVGELMVLGYLLGDKSWFEGVQLLSPGSTLTWDEADGSLHRRRYWWWDHVKPLDSAHDKREVMEELANRFVRSVARRVQGPATPGLLLSGGFDSRAVLAAWPSGDRPIETLTFGRRGCFDVRVARQVAVRKGANQHVWEMTSRNWLWPRIKGVWLAEAAAGFLHLHGIEALGLIRECFSICLGGGGLDSLCKGYFLQMMPKGQPVTADFLAQRLGCRPELLGDVSMYAHEQPDVFWIENRIRRFISVGPTWVGSAVVHRQPYNDNDLVEFAYSLPASLRGRGIDGPFVRALVNGFPEFFRRIPESNSGLPPAWPQAMHRAGAKAVNARRRMTRVLSRVGLEWPGRSDFALYAAWLRADPAFTFLNGLLLDKDSLYPEYLSRSVVEQAFLRHRAGYDNSELLGRCATLEIWLRQLLTGEFRPDYAAGAKRLG